jgi:GTP-binding protein
MDAGTLGNVEKCVTPFMKITSAEFIKSAYTEEHWTLDNLPEISFLGRSNVGKSSLLNSLLNRKGLARTSNTPGRTQCINFFLVNRNFYFVDLPGYGYAKVSKVMRQDWGVMAEEYLAKRPQLMLSIQLIDSRHKPSKLDEELNEWLVFNQKNHIIVATKADKLSSKKLEESLAVIRKTMPNSKVITFSATKNIGRDEVWQEIYSTIQKK